MDGYNVGIYRYKNKSQRKEWLETAMPLVYTLFFAVLSIAFGTLLIYLFSNGRIVAIADYVLENKWPVFLWTTAQILAVPIYLYAPLIACSIYSGFVFTLAFISFHAVWPAIMLMLAVLFFLIRNIMIFMEVFEIKIGIGTWIVTTTLNIYTIMYIYGLFSSDDNSAYFFVSRFVFPIIITCIIGRLLYKYRNETNSFYKGFYEYAAFFVIYQGDDYGHEKYARLLRNIMYVLSATFLIIPIFPYRKTLINGFADFTIENSESICSLLLNIIIAVIIIKAVYSRIRRII